MARVDTNVLIDVLQDDPQWADWSISQMRAQARVHPLAINPVINAEISLSFSTLEALDPSRKPPGPGSCSISPAINLTPAKAGQSQTTAGDDAEWTAGRQ